MDNPEYTGPEADARAAAIESAIGTEDERLADTVWLLRYVGVKAAFKWPVEEPVDG